MPRDVHRGGGDLQHDGLAAARPDAPRRVDVRRPVHVIAAARQQPFGKDAAHEAIDRPPRRGAAAQQRTDVRPAGAIELHPGGLRPVPQHEAQETADRDEVAFHVRRQDTVAARRSPRRGLLQAPGLRQNPRTDRDAHKSTSFEDADRWDKQQQWAMTPDERLAIAKELRDRFYGTNCPDVREAERSK